ncbi:MAG TPA: tetratricopeptide repeat protein [Allosphingosinicella sp.]|nr:tetratricopeptide repeat protein [Allosphingosinicella sp.]
MRYHLLGLVLMTAVAAPALAQSRPDTVERRVDRLEQQLRAVQRRVFPAGGAQTVEPEIPADVQAAMGGAPPGNAMSSLIARVDSLDAQLRTLTGQVEEQSNRTRQIEDGLARLRADLANRIERLEAPPPRAAEPRLEPRPEPALRETAAQPARAAPAAPDAAEEAYNAGYRLWDQRRFAEAQAALEAAATRYPSSRWTSWMRNLQGRAYLDENKPATAARILLANYQDNPRGERAADSLFYLGQALTRLNRRPEACRVYDELAQVYSNMRDFIRTRLPEARTAARCAAN